MGNRTTLVGASISCHSKPDIDRVLPLHLCIIPSRERTLCPHAPAPLTITPSMQTAAAAAAAAAANCLAARNMTLAGPPGSSCLGPRSGTLRGEAVAPAARDCAAAAINPIRVLGLCTTTSGGLRGRGAFAAAAAPATAAPAPAALINPIGVHGLCFAGQFDEAGMRTAAAGAAAAGYDLLEIAAFNAASLDASMTRAVCEEHRLQCACSLGLTLDADISSDDAEIVARGAAVLDDALAFAEAAGAAHLCGVLYSALAKYPGPPTQHGRSNAVREVRRLSAKAADAGIPVSLEVVNRYETNLLNTAAQAMDFLADVNHSNVYVHLDTYHMHIEESDIGATVRLCGDRCGYIHIGESHRGYLGTGSVDFTALFRSLAEIGYSGPITFESFSSRVVLPALSNTLCVWRDMWQDSHSLTAHARDMIRRSLTAAQLTARQSAGGM